MAPDVPQPAWIQIPTPALGGEPLEGRTILLHYEQGLGDTVQFIRFAPQVKERGGQVWVFCQPPMVRLLSLCSSVDRVLDAARRKFPNSRFTQA